ncbi:MAG: polysaccharide biosynthesis C-terminal domain-containing protein [Dokdonella sp.]
MNARSQAIRNTLFSSVGIYTEYVLGLLTSIFIARHLGPADFGAYSSIIWLVAMGVAMTNAGTASAVIKFVAELRGGGREELIAPTIAYLHRAQRWFLAAVLAGGALLFWVAGERVAPGLNHVMVFCFLVVGIAFRAQYMFNVGIAKGFENFRATAIVAAIATPLNLGMVILAWWLDAQVETLLAVFIISGAVFYGISYWQTARLIPVSRVHVALPDDLLRRVRRYMKFVAVTAAVVYLAASDVEVFFLTTFGTAAAAAGQFKVAYQLASGAAMLVPGVISALLLPMMASALSQGRDVAGRRFVASTTYLTLVAAPLVAFGVMFAEPIVLFMYGVEYTPAVTVFAVCLFACALYTVSQSASSLLVSADRQATILAVVISSGVLKVVLGIWLIRMLGLDGAMLAYVSVAVFSTVTMMVIALRVIGMQPHWTRLLRIILAAGLSAVAVYPLVGLWPPLPTIVVGAAAIAVVYALLTILLRCWSREDIDHLLRLHMRYARGRPQAFGRLLQWSGRVDPEALP